MEDFRSKKISDEIESEKGLSKSNFAFTGFGRSTKTAESLTPIEKAGQERLAQLAQVIALEKIVQAGLGDEATGEALANAVARLQELEAKAAKRRLDLGQKLSGAGRTADKRLSDKLRLSAAKYRPPKPKKFTFGKVKAPVLGAKKLNLRTKSLKGFAPTKSIKSVTGKQKGFARTKTLSGNNP